MQDKNMMLLIFYSVIIIIIECNGNGAETAEIDITQDGNNYVNDEQEKRPTRHGYLYDLEDDEIDQKTDRKKPCYHQHKAPFRMPPDHNTLMSGFYRYPFAVAIWRKDVFYATGVLVDHKWVLSCAKPFFKKNAKRFRARIGSTNSRHAGVVMDIKRIVIFPMYKDNEPNFDIALLNLFSPVRTSNDIQTINWSHNDLSIFITIYWPRTIINGKQIPRNAPERINYNHIRATSQNPMFREECSKHLTKDGIMLEPPTVCLSPIRNLHSPCLADPGAPVLSFTGLMGITSGWVSPRCKLRPSDSPVVITRTSSPLIRTWMKETMKEKYKKKLEISKMFMKTNINAQKHQSRKNKKIFISSDPNIYDGWI